MWVVHEPGSCAKSKGSSNNRTSNSPDPKAMFMAQLKESGASAEEIESEMEAIMVVMES